MGAIRAKLPVSIPRNLSASGPWRNGLPHLPPLQLHEDSWLPRRDLQKSLPGLASRAHYSATAPGRMAPLRSMHSSLQPHLPSSIEKIPQHDRPFLYGGSSPMRGPPLGTQEVCTVPSLPTILGHGGSGNKVTFRKFLVQQGKANAVIS